MLRIWKAGRKSLAFALALMLALSSLGAPAVAWVHDDGSPCSVCSQLRPVLTEVCCAPAELAVEAPADDCRSCCEAARHEDSVQQSPPLLYAALPSQRAQVTASSTAAARPHVQERLGARAVLHSPPSLRGPPSCGRVS